MTKYITIESDGATTGMYDDAVRPPPDNAIQVTDAIFVQCGPGVAYVNGELVAYTPPAIPLTSEQQAQVAMSAGLTVTSSGTPSLDGVFNVSGIAQQRISAEITSILLSGGFADGAETVEWLDMEGAEHTLTVAQFKSFAAAVSAYVAALTKCMLGQSTTLPLATVTIP